MSNSKIETLTLSDFNLDGVDTSKYDMSRVEIVTQGFEYLKAYGSHLLPSDRVPAHVVEDIENWEIVAEDDYSTVSFSDFPGEEGKLEYHYETYYLIAPLKETEKPEFFKFEEEAAALGFDEYAA